jgi:hypothetical protein
VLVLVGQGLNASPNEVDLSLTAQVLKLNGRKLIGVRSDQLLSPYIWSWIWIDVTASVRESRLPSAHRLVWRECVRQLGARWDRLLAWRGIGRRDAITLQRRASRSCRGGRLRCNGIGHALSLIYRHNRWVTYIAPRRRQIVITLPWWRPVDSGGRLSSGRWSLLLGRRPAAHGSRLGLSYEPVLVLWARRIVVSYPRKVQVALIDGVHETPAAGIANLVKLV